MKLTSATITGRYQVPESSAQPSQMSVLARYNGWRTIEYAPSVFSRSAVGCVVPRAEVPGGAAPMTIARTHRPESAIAKQKSSNENGAAGRREGARCGDDQHRAVPQRDARFSHRRVFGVSLHSPGEPLHPRADCAVRKTAGGAGVSVLPVDDSGSRHALRALHVKSAGRR